MSRKDGDRRGFRPGGSLLCWRAPLLFEFGLTEKSNYMDRGMIQLTTDLTKNMKASSWRILRVSKKNQR